MEKTRVESLESQTTSVVPRRCLPRLRNLGGRASKRRTAPDPLPVAPGPADEPEALPPVPDDEPEDPEEVELPGRLGAEGAVTGVDGDDTVVSGIVVTGVVTAGTLTLGTGLVTTGTLTLGTVGTLTVGTGSSANACAQPIASSADAPRTPKAPLNTRRASAVWFPLA
jgi:hypothetical protein